MSSIAPFDRLHGGCGTTDDARRVAPDARGSSRQKAHLSRLGDEHEIDIGHLRFGGRLGGRAPGEHRLEGTDAPRHGGRSEQLKERSAADALVAGPHHLYPAESME
jgi:hypothetical protein